MASNLESSIEKGSESFFDFSCYTCQENDRYTEAEFYCEECSKFYCSKCVEYHNYLFKKHAILSKKNVSQWPETSVGVLEKCQEHRKEKLTVFCEDHSQLICQVCHVHNHQKCSKVLLIADKVKDLHQKGDFKQLSATVETQHRQLIQKKDDLEENIKTLEKSYKKILEEINALRKKINASLDQLEKNTKMALDSLLATMRTSIQTDIENCMESFKNIACVKEDWLRKEENNQALSLIKYRKCIDKSLKVEAFLQEMTTKNERTLTFNPDTTIQQTLSTLSGLGKILSTMKPSQPAKKKTQNTVTHQNKPEASSQSGNQITPGLKINQSSPESSASRQYNPVNQTKDLTKPGQVSDPVSSSSHQLVQDYQPDVVRKSYQIIKVKSSKKYSVKIEGDKNACYITGICETATGELLIADHGNRKLKFLDQHYKVVAHLDMSGDPWSMCSIDSSLVAVTLLYNSEVHFIRVTNGQVIKDRILQLKHNCLGIAHHQGNLYITDGIALYHYTVDGRLVSKMYEEKGRHKVDRCAVSPDGDRIYVTNRTSNQLVTLSRDGKVISTLADASLNNIGDVHVTDSGQVLVSGNCTIYQVDSDGRYIQAEVVTVNDGVTDLTSSYFSKQRGSLIVGKQYNDDIIVFEAQ